MARIRTVKPEYWDSPGIETLHPYWRCLYVAMWNWADDSGRGKAEARELMGFAFPRDEDMTVSEFRFGMSEVARVFGVKFYRVAGRAFFEIPSWSRHQKIDKRSASRHPAPSEGEPFDPVDGSPLGGQETRRSESDSAGTRRELGGLSPLEQGNRGKGN